MNHLDYLDLSRLSWKRPEGPPKVWRVVEGRKKTDDGRTLKFSIQDVPKDRQEDVVDYMCQYFLVEEPTCVDTKAVEEPLAIQEMSTLWRSLVRKGICVVALMDNPEGGKPLIAGANMLGVICKQDEQFLETLKFRSKALSKIMPTILRLAHEADIFSKYGEDKYMTAMGLSVLPTLRGQGLGEQILRSREDIGREFRIPVTETAFSATASQILAARIGYEVLVERKYSELLNEKGEVTFPSITVPYMKIMGMRLY